MTISLLTVRPLLKTLADVRAKIVTKKNNSNAKEDQLTSKNNTIANL
jgi:hypothetical protein